MGSRHEDVTLETQKEKININGFNNVSRLYFL